MRAALEELLPQFERASGRRVAVSYDPAKIMLRRIESGETAGIFADSPRPEAARSLLDFLSTPAAARVFRAKGFDPA